MVPVAPKVLWSSLRDNRTPAHLVTVRGNYLSTVNRLPAANLKNDCDAPLRSIADREKKGKIKRSCVADEEKADRRKKLNASD